jgi:hypothetical protein
MSDCSNSTLYPPPTGDVHDLSIVWRVRAAELRRVAAAESAARAFEIAADELAAVLTTQSERLLGIAEAAALVGRHRDTIGNAVRDGRLANRGTKFRPRVKFSDLIGLFGAQTVVSQPERPYSRRADARTGLETRRGD